MLILASHAHQAQAAQTLQSAKYYWNYLKKSMRAGTAQAITVAQKHPQIFAAGAVVIAVVVIPLANRLYKAYRTPVQPITQTSAAPAATATTTSATPVQIAIDTPAQTPSATSAPDPETSTPAFAEARTTTSATPVQTAVHTPAQAPVFESHLKTAGDQSYTPPVQSAATIESKRQFDALIISRNIREITVLAQKGSTCGTHAVKNARLGLTFFDNKEKTTTEMQSQDIYDQTIPKGSQSQSNLREDAVQELANLVFANQPEGSVYVLQNPELFVNLFEIRPDGGSVLTEDAATMVYRLSQPSYTVSFVINTVQVTDNHRTGAHWIAFTVKKNQGIVTDIIFMDSINKSLSQETVRHLFNMCSKNTEQLMRELKEYNTSFPVYSCAERITRYKKNNKEHQLIDDNFYSLAAFLSNKTPFMNVTADSKIVQQEKLLDAQEINVIFELLKFKNHLNDTELKTLKTIIDHEKKEATSSDTAQTDTANNNGSGGEKMDQEEEGNERNFLQQHFASLGLFRSEKQ